MATLQCAQLFQLFKKMGPCKRWYLHRESPCDVTAVIIAVLQTTYQYVQQQYDVSYSQRWSQLSYILIFIGAQEVSNTGQALFLFEVGIKDTTCGLQLLYIVALRFVSWIKR
jgi:hypothetical protein